MPKRWKKPLVLIATGAGVALFLAYANLVSWGLAQEGLTAPTPLFIKVEAAAFAVALLAAILAALRLRIAGVVAVAAAAVGYCGVLIDGDVYNPALELVLWTLPAALLVSGGLFAMARGQQRVMA